jgi:hypothetical protein
LPRAAAGSSSKTGGRLYEAEVLSLQEVQAIPFPGWIQGILQLLRVDEVLHLQLSRLLSGPDGVEQDRGR